MSKHKHCDVIKAWADGSVIQCMQEVGELKGQWRTIINPNWDETSEYRASLAIVEGRPVFEGDVLYGGEMEFIANPKTTFSIKDGGIYDLSWNPQKPKTVTIELLREDAEYLASLPPNSVLLKRISEVCRDALK